MSATKKRMEKPDLTLVIPTSGRADSVDRLLRSLFLQDFEISKVEVIVAMTGFDPLQEERIARWQGHLNIRGVVAGALGLNHARNLAARIALGEVVLFIDDHFELRQNDILKSHLEYHRDPDLTGLGGSSTIPADASIAAHAFHLAGRNGGHVSYKRRVFSEGGRFEASPEADESLSALDLRTDATDLKFRYADEIRPLRHDDATLKALLKKAFLEGYRRENRKRSDRAEDDIPSPLRDALPSPLFSERTPLWRRSLLKLYARAYRWGAEQGRRHAAGASSPRTSRIARWLEVAP